MNVLGLRRQAQLGALLCPSCTRLETTVDTTTLLIILIVLLVLGGGFYGRRRWF